MMLTHTCKDKNRNNYIKMSLEIERMLSSDRVFLWTVLAGVQCVYMYMKKVHVIQVIEFYSENCIYI